MFIKNKRFTTIFELYNYVTCQLVYSFIPTDDDSIFK